VYRRIGSEFARFIDRNLGLFNADLYQYAKFFKTSFNLNKSERLQYHYGAATHAMALTGVDVRAFCHDDHSPLPLLTFVCERRSSTERQ
jgi:aminopeptidase C